MREILDAILAENCHAIGGIDVPDRYRGVTVWGDAVEGGGEPAGTVADEEPEGGGVVSGPVSWLRAGWVVQAPVGWRVVTRRWA